MLLVRIITRLYPAMGEALLFKMLVSMYSLICMYTLPAVGLQILLNLVFALQGVSNKYCPLDLLL